MFRLLLFLALAAACPLFAASRMEYDYVIRGGTLFDGSGSPGVTGDVAIRGDRIAAVGTVTGRGRTEIQARGLAVAPGFINMLSWANLALIHDGRSQSDIRQGVTLEVLGEGVSMGPLNPLMRGRMQREQSRIPFQVEWTTLGGFLDWLERRGISPNVASFVGATTLRMHEIGEADRPPTPEELRRMTDLARQAMEEGAMGLSSALIYAPAFFAKTDELTALARAVADYRGLYISHLRSEGDKFREALDEFLAIARSAKIDAEIYHLKAAGQHNWDKLPGVIAKIEQARAEGLRITADMYLYTAGATGLDASMPPWVQEGGRAQWIERLRNPDIRQRVKSEMQARADDWENFYVAAGSPTNIVLSGFKTDKLRRFVGKTLAQAAQMRGQSPEDTAIDLVIEDGSRVDAIYFFISEDNIRRQVQLPWVSFGSDSSSLAPEGVFLQSNPHPRAYGNFARLLGKYARDEKLISLGEAVRRLTSLPAENLKIADRGWLKPGYFADLAIFDPDKIRDRATFAKPHQYATGMRHVFVNGTPVLKNGKHTGAKPGRTVRGPGWKPPRSE